MEEKKQYSALTIDRAAFLLLRVKKAFKKKKLQRKERERNDLLTTIGIGLNCVGIMCILYYACCCCCCPHQTERESPITPKQEEEKQEQPYTPRSDENDNSLTETIVSSPTVSTMRPESTAPNMDELENDIPLQYIPGIQGYYEPSVTVLSPPQVTTRPPGLTKTLELLIEYAIRIFKISTLMRSSTIKHESKLSYDHIHQDLFEVFGIVGKMAPQCNCQKEEKLRLAIIERISIIWQQIDEIKGALSKECAGLLLRLEVDPVDLGEIEIAFKKCTTTYYAISHRSLISSQD